MKRFFTIFCLISFIGVFSPVSAAVQVPANLSVPINVSQKYTSKTVTSGGSVNAQIAEDVYVNNILVFKKGDKAALNILSAKKAGFVGIPGEMVISGGKVFDINGDEHRIDFNQQLTGDEKTWPKVCLACGVFIILAPIALFGLVKGGQAEINPINNIDSRITTTFNFQPSKL